MSINTKCSSNKTLEKIYDYMTASGKDNNFFFFESVMTISNAWYNYTNGELCSVSKFENNNKNAALEDVGESFLFGDC